MSENRNVPAAELELGYRHALEEIERLCNREMARTNYSRTFPKIRDIAAKAMFPPLTEAERAQLKTIPEPTEIKVAVDEVSARRAQHDTIAWSGRQCGVPGCSNDASWQWSMWGQERAVCTAHRKAKPEDFR